MTNHAQDFSDDLATYMAKNGMESESLWRLGVQAEQQKLRLAAVRQTLYELEHARLDLSNAVLPFLPEPAPVALQGDPTPYTNGHAYNGHPYDPNQYDEDLAMPACLRERA